MLSKKFIYVSIFLMFSCLNNNKQNLEHSAYSIINLCLNEIQNKAAPPIPPNWKGDTIATERFKKMNSFAISPNLFEISKNDKVKRILKNKYNLFFIKENKVFNQLIKVKHIQQPSAISIEVKSFEDIDLNKRENWKPYNVIINFSEIRFNKTMDKACLVYSIAYAKNNGYSILVTLKKIENKWEIASSNLLTLS